LNFKRSEFVTTDTLEKAIAKPSKKAFIRLEAILGLAEKILIMFIS